MGKILNCKEVAEILNVDESTVRRYCIDGTIEAIKLKREWRISQKALKEFLK